MMENFLGIAFGIAILAFAAFLGVIAYGLATGTIQ